MTASACSVTCALLWSTSRRVSGLSLVLFRLGTSLLAPPPLSRASQLRLYFVRPLRSGASPPPILRGSRSLPGAWPSASVLTVSDTFAKSGPAGVLPLIGRSLFAMYRGPSSAGRSKATGATLCQKCLKRDESPQEHEFPYCPLTSHTALQLRVHYAIAGETVQVSPIPDATTG